MTKQEIRKHIRQLKSSYTPDDLTQMSHQLCAKVINTPQWRNTSTVLLYSSLPDEVNTDDLIDAAQREKKRILLPVVTGDDLILREFTGEYTLGAFNIKEPTGPVFSLPFLGDDERGLLAIIPGMAFDHQNNRLGRGKGYYDRLLSRFVSTTTHHPSPTSTTHHQSPITYLLGLCFPFQYIPNIPAEPHDIKMNSIIHSYE